MSGHRIRPGTPDDLDAIRRIEALAFEPVRRSSVAALRRALSSAFQRVRVLEVDGDVAGYLIVWPYRRTWRIYNLASDPRRQKQGVGGALLAAAGDEARRAGAQWLVLECRDEPRLRRFYEQRGFRAVRHLPDYYSEGQSALRMALTLTAGD